MKAGLALLLAGLLAGSAVAAAGRFHTGRLMLAAGLPTAAAILFEDPAWKGVALLQAGDAAAAAAVLRRTKSPEAAYNLGNALALSGDLTLAVKAYDLALARDGEDADARANKALVEAAIAAGRDGGGGDPTKGAANSGADRVHDAGRDDTDTRDDTGSEASFGDGMIGNRESGATSDTGGSSKVGKQGRGRQDDSAAGAGEAKGSAGAGAGETGRGAGATSAAEGDAPDRPPPPTVTVDETRQATLQWLAAIPDDPARFLKRRIGAERDRRIAAGTAVQPGGEGW